MREFWRRSGIGRSCLMVEGMDFAWVCWQRRLGVEVEAEEVTSRSDGVALVKVTLSPLASARHCSIAPSTADLLDRTFPAASAGKAVKRLLVV